MKNKYFYAKNKFFRDLGHEKHTFLCNKVGFLRSRVWKTYIFMQKKLFFRGHEYEKTIFLYKKVAISRSGLCKNQHFYARKLLFRRPGYVKTYIFVWDACYFKAQGAVHLQRLQRAVPIVSSGLRTSGSDREGHGALEAREGFEKHISIALVCFLIVLVCFLIVGAPRRRGPHDILRGPASSKNALVLLLCVSS